MPRRTRALKRAVKRAMRRALKRAVRRAVRREVRREVRRAVEPTLAVQSRRGTSPRTRSWLSLMYAPALEATAPTHRMATAYTTAPPLETP